ncbi:hypothetical protein ABTX80_04280 [Streptomyces erythrochromogenes]|uniref:hypothetical protein n=1 Tax=Streptomyces erythrochromogenes TaxID=285574 RepID=UPI00331E8638
MHQHSLPHSDQAQAVHHPHLPDPRRRELLLASPLTSPPRSRPRKQRGAVLRITHTYEYRVTDEDALLRAAAERGWRPLPASERDQDDPRDLIGAMTALTAHPDVAGTRPLEHRSTAELHTLNPVPAPLLLPVRAPGPGPGSGPGGADGPAHRGAARPPDERTESVPAGRTPDFAALFAPRNHPCTVADRQAGKHRWQLTPRTADLLHTALAVLADQAYDDAQYLADRLLSDAGPASPEVFDRLPPVTWSADHRWRRRMARAFDDLAGDLVDGHVPEPTCTAEEVALHLAVQDVPAHLEDLCEDDEHNRLPQHRDDYDLSRPPFRNEDVLVLFRTGPAGPVGLGRVAWFTPFDPRSARNPRRGFRR